MSEMNRYATDKNIKHICLTFVQRLFFKRSIERKKNAEKK